MLKHRYASLLLAALAAAHFGCGSCGGDEDPEGVAPQITSDPVTTAVVGEDYRYHLTVTGTPEPTVTVTGADGGELPGWLAFDAETLTLLGLAPESQVGVHQVIITAGNGEEPDAVQEFEITVSLGGVAPQFVSEPDTEAFTGAEYVYVVDATGSPEPTFQATNDSGGALAGWLVFDIESGTLSGTPAIADIGDHSVVITAGNGIDPQATQSFTINVSRSQETPLITSTPVLEVVEGEAYSYEVEATGFPVPVIAAGGAEGADLPVWLTMEDGLLSGTPGADDVGEHDIVIAATNVVGTDSQVFTITVARAPFAPTITSTPVLEAVVGDAYTYELTATGHPAPVLAATTLPGWLSLDAATGVVSGTPAAGDVGDNQVELTATNDEGLDTQSFTIAVTPALEAPVITSAAVETAEAHVLYSYQVVATGYPVPTFAFTGADWLSIDETTGLLSGTPGFADVGEFSIEVVASNSQGSASQTFVITVTAVDTAPIFTSMPGLTVLAGVEYVYQIEADGYPLPTLSVTGLPLWLTFDGIATISGTPLIFDVGETAEITVTATNAVDPDAQQVFTITVEAPQGIDISAAPLLESFGTELPQGWSSFGSWEFGAPTSGPNAAFEGDHVAATVLAGNYPNSDYSVLATPVLDLTNVEDAEFRFYHWYRFEQGFDKGRLVYSADGGLTWAVVPEETIWPVESRYNRTITSERWWSLDSALEGWRRVIVDLDTLVGLERDQVVLGFEFRSDSSAVRAGWYVDDVQIGSANVLITAPTITSSPTLLASADAAYSYQVVAKGVPAPVLSASAPEGQPLPAWLGFDPATGILSGTPPTAALGAHDIEIRAANGIDPDAVQAFTLTVVDYVVAAPEITSIPATVGITDVEYVYTIVATGGPAPTITVAGLPAWLSFDGVDTISGTPNRLRVGTTGNITVTATNGVSPADQQVFTITVEAPAAIAVAGDPVFETFGTQLPMGWFANGDWEFGTPTNGPGAAFDGEHLAATRLGGNYTNSTLSSLISPVLDLTGIGDPMLRFAHWYHTETGLYDGGNVKISRDGGATFHQMVPGSVLPAYTGTITSTTHVLAGQSIWHGPASGWRHVEIDLQANLDGHPVDRVVLRFDFGADGSVNNPGWYVDFVRIGQESELPKAPTIVSVPELFGAIGVAYHYQVVAEGQPAPTLSASGAGGADLPLWLFFDPATGILSGTPLEADLGEHVVVITAANGFGSGAVQTFTLTVLTEIPVAPEITSVPSETGEIDVLYTYVIAATGTPAPSISVAGLPSWLSFDGIDTVSGTPTRFSIGQSTLTVTATNGIAPAAQQVFTITVAAPEAISLAGAPFSESFADTIPMGWMATGDWEFGTPTVGPATAYEGDHLAGTLLAANYNNSRFSSMLSPVFDLTDIGDPVLRFAHWFATETGGWDGGNVKISRDGGVTFHQLVASSVVPAYSGLTMTGTTSMPSQPAWFGNSSGWQLVEIDLAANLDGHPVDQVVIRFDFGSDSSGNGAGWYIDAVEVGSAIEMDLVDVVVFDFDGSTNLASYVDAGVTVGPFTHARGATTYPQGNPTSGVAISTNTWHENDNYFEFQVTPNAGVEPILYQLAFDDRASGTGPTQWEVMLVDSLGVETSIGTGTTHTGFTAGPMNVVTFGVADAGPLTEAFTIRIRGTIASAATGTWRLDNVKLTGLME